MIQRMLTSALGAGGAAGLLAALLHFAFVQEYILLGETYETGALTHFAAGTGISDNLGAVAGHAHDAPAPSGADGAADGAGVAHTHDHTHDHGPPPSDLARNGLTVLFTVLVYSAYGLILVAGFGLAENLGHRIRAGEGLLWGLAGFAAFQMAPAMGLAPELPGTIAADLGARQVWWWGTAAATACAVALMGYVRTPAMLLLAVALLAAPHLIGAPHPAAFQGVAPPEVAATFAARVLGVGLAIWLVLGWAAGRLWQRGTPA